MINADQGDAPDNVTVTRIKNVSYTNDEIELNAINPKTGELLWTLLIESVPWRKLSLQLLIYRLSSPRLILSETSKFQTPYRC